MTKLLRTLLRASIGDPDFPRGGGWESVLREIPRSRWMETIRILEQHRLMPLVAWMLNHHGLVEVLPGSMQTVVVHAYRSALFANTLHCQALESVLVTLNRFAIEPTLFKGVVLASSYYPDLGARPMGDVDILITPRADFDLDACLGESGFRRSDGPSPGEDYYQDSRGTVLDVHDRFRLFEGFEPEQLERSWALPSGGAGVARIWEANAMLVHLAVHAHQHRPGTGLVLMWLVDLAFVMKRHLAELDYARIRALTAPAGDLTFLLRALGFLHGELGVALPDTLIEPVSRSVPLTLARVLRERRTRPWRLGTVRGWGRLLMARIRGRAGDQVALPSLRDLALGPFDQLRDRVSRRPGGAG